MMFSTPLLNAAGWGLSLYLLLFPGVTLAAGDLPGDYHLLNEPAIEEPGKVVLLEFADFYCPHCHLFEQTVATKLKKEFGNRLEVRLVGFPVMRGKLPTAFEMYEQAQVMGKGTRNEDTPISYHSP